MFKDPGTKNGLHIITPPHLRVAREVEDPLAVLPEALDILRGIRNKAFSFPGSPYQECYAIAQPQVSDRPLRYFVLNDGERFQEVVKQYGGLVIVNPHLEHKDKTSRLMWKDGCMSYPFRPVVKVKRYTEIDVSYDIITDVEGKLLTKPKVEKIRNKHLSGEAALVFLHELEHLNGKSIYTK